MKILLINLPKEGETRETSTPDYLLYDFVSYPPLGLMAIAAGISPEHQVKILDVIVDDMGIEETVESVRQYRPDVLGVSVVSRRLYPFYELTKRVKKLLLETRIVAGGPHVNYFPMESMELGTLDYALPGFGEKKFPQLIDAIDRGEDPDALSRIPELHYRANGQTKVNPPGAKALNLDDLPFPDRSLIDLDKYYTVADKAKMTTAYTSRGCPFRCIYCDVQEKKFHYRSAKKIVDEFEYIQSLGIKEIFIFDDTFNINRQRVIDMCNEILRRGLDVKWAARARVYPFDREMLSLMKRAGCIRLHVGIEALDPDILEYINKKVTLRHIQKFFELCNDVKINTLAYFIIGFPGETEQYKKTLFAEIKKLKPTYVYVNILAPMAKTELYEQMLKDGTFKEDYWGEFMKNPVPNFALPIYRSPELQKELIDLADNIHRKFYLSPRFIIDDIRRGITFKMFLVKARAAMLLVANTLLRNIIKRK